MSQPPIVLNADFFAEIRIILTQAQQKVSSAASVAMVEAFWQIGRRIVEEEQKGEKRAKYGKQVLKELSKQLTQEFGNGFSERNLEYIRKFFDLPGASFANFADTVCEILSVCIIGCRRRGEAATLAW